MSAGRWDAMRRYGRDRRVLIVLAASLGLIAAIAVLFTVGPLAPQRDPTWERIQRQGVMRVGMDASYPPFEVQLQDGSYQGYDVDLAREIGSRLGVGVEFVNVHFDGLYDALRTGKFDLIISALPYDRFLTRDVLYSYSYFNAGQVILEREGESSVQSLSDLDGRRVGVELGSAGHERLRTLQREKGVALQLTPFTTPEEARDALLNGEVDVVVVDAITAYEFVGRGGVQIVEGILLTDEPYVIAVTLQSPILLEKVNGILVQLREECVLDALRERWLLSAH
ncbi:MAG: amino acid ABC transporter substrate-binding protein [Chloroflexi bacterium]|nr:amino acid ABC transporter substrate-binding protein [Chloroflexota bacterium]